MRQRWIKIVGRAVSLAVALIATPIATGAWILAAQPASAQVEPGITPSNWHSLSGNTAPDARILAQTGVAPQRLVPIPTKAKRADITFSNSPEVLLDGKSARLAPGVRIYSTANMLVMWGSLAGTFKSKYLVEETTGLVIGVWILTPDEIAAPDPKS